MIEKTKSGDRQHLLLDSVEKMVNKVLSLDEETVALLATLAGNVIEIDVLDTEFRMFILPSGKGVTLETDYEGKADVAIKGTPSALLGMISAEKIGAGDVEINGNVELAKKFQSILRDVEIDWEEYLSQFVGDIAAHKIGNFLRRVSRFAKESGKTIGMDISEYLRYEKEALLDKSEVDEFNQAVDNIRDDVERLQKRLERLEKENS
ncbi:MAG: sterol-binding protein [Gammaproteobacteria bacterium]|nr:SCP2 sterol-binding domain-containing protein [Pseudomonadota bacterium]MCH8976897.1 SCP2 sterol-binding domain-containing protein [Pseudomonadota bacterium]TDJ16576.1 MAG: sterol-binding protein [Gammaproteobacteria bacterium]